MGEDAWRFVGHDVSSQALDLVRTIISDYPTLSREELAATVCELLEWKRPTGRLKARECREWLERLSAAGMIALPPKRAGRPGGTGTSIPRTARGEAQPVVSGTVRDIAPILIERVTTPDQRGLFRELVGRYHYLGHTVPFGASLRYLVVASQPERQVVGCVQFSSAAWRMAARDRWIGWDEETRRRILPHVVANSRFLVLPWVHVANLASHVLALAARQVVEDWRQRHGVEPWLAETLVDPARLHGGCYRAANWLPVGTTAGRGRMDRAHARHGVEPKTIFVYPLVRDARERLRRGAVRP
jgi:hypothetical protein